MSSTVHVFLNCDKCGDSTEDFGVLDKRTIRQVRKMAKEEGWIYLGGRDFCERCAKEFKSINSMRRG